MTKTQARYDCILDLPNMSYFDQNSSPLWLRFGPPKYALILDQKDAH